MGLFDFFKKEEKKQILNEPTPCILNLNKNDILDLNKVSENLNKVRVSAGWDVCVVGQDYDLDLCAMLVNKNDKLVDCVYYASKRSKGLYLDGDNLTGEGEGDDENIFVTLKEIPSSVSKIVFNVVIYQGANRHQQFKNVSNAYVRLVDIAHTEREICRYNLSNDGGDNTAVKFAELIRTNDGWQFHAIGNYLCGSISDLANQYK